MINTYTSTQKFLHWALFALVILLYALTYGEEFYPRGDPTVDAIWRLHISFGLLLAAFVLWRVVLRGLRGRPGLPAEMSKL
ncbi:MAG: cytochrome b, partial [Mesorhizobium sp.]